MVLVAVGAGYGIAFTFEQWGTLAAFAFVIVFSAVAILGINICGWLFVGWDLVAPGKGAGSRGEHAGDDSKMGDT